MACYDRFFGRGHTAYRLEHYIELLAQRPRSVWNAKPVKYTVPARLMRFLEKLEAPKQVVYILRNYLAAPERVMQIVAVSGNYSQAMLELNRVNVPISLPQKDIPVSRPDQTQYDRLLQRRDVV